MRPFAIKRPKLVLIEICTFVCVCPTAEVLRWCLANGDNKMLRIAMCGHVGQHEALEQEGWDVQTWRTSGGYQGADDRERIWFSPHCLSVTQAEQMAFSFS